MAAPDLGLHAPLAFYQQAQAAEAKSLSPDELRRMAMKRGRRPSVTSLVLQTNIAGYVRDDAHGIYLLCS
jgi:hypothetical protein